MRSRLAAATASAGEKGDGRMRHRLCLALALITAALLPTSAYAQGLSGIIEGFPTVRNTATQAWSATATHFWALNTNQEPAAFATWSLNVPQSGLPYELQVFIPAPALQESRPRTRRAIYEIRPPVGAVATRFFLNQAVTTSHWIPVPSGFFTFDQPGTYQLILSGRTSDAPGTRVVVASAIRLVPGSSPGAPGGIGQPQLEEAQAQRAFELINELRQQHGVALLNRNLALDRAEAGHVLDMATNRFVSADGSDGLGATQRAIRQGYSPRQLTVWISVGEATAEQLLRDYPREILDPLYTDVGIALAFAPVSPHVYYWSVVVATQ
jgi:uncharacterized protein YkwD